jgi:methionyl-tRNA formyltransferase
MGTPEFAVGIGYYNQNNYTVVNTAADKPAGRTKLKYSAVKEYALANNLTITTYKP